MSEKKYQNFEIILMDVKSLKEELASELKKEHPDEDYIQEILDYGAWGDSINRLGKKNDTIEKAFRLLHNNKKMTLPFLAIKGYLSLIKPMLENPNLDVNEVDKQHNNTPLYWALHFNQPQIIKELLKHPKINPNVKTANGSTALIEALRWGHSQVVEEILQYPKINPNVQDNGGFTALHWASDCGRSQVVQVLLKHPKINPNVKNADGFTALHLASSEGHSQVVQALLKHPKINPNVKNADGDTALHLATRWGHSQAVQELLKHPKINPNVKRANGSTALHWATRKDNLEIVQALLNHPKTNPNIFDNSGFSPLIHTIYFGHSKNSGKIVAEFLKNPRSTNQNRIVVSCGDVSDGNLIIMACDRGNLDPLVELLKDPDADPNFQDKYGQTALHLASKYSGERRDDLMVKELLKHPKTDSNIKDSDGNTALMCMLEEEERTELDNSIILQLEKHSKRNLKTIVD